MFPELAYGLRSGKPTTHPNDRDRFVLRCKIVDPARLFQGYTRVGGWRDHFFGLTGGLWHMLSLESPPSGIVLDVLGGMLNFLCFWVCLLYTFNSRTIARDQPFGGRLACLQRSFQCCCVLSKTMLEYLRDVVVVKQN